MLIEGECTCEICNKIIEWCYLVPNHISERFSVHVMPRNKVQVSVETRNNDMTPIRVSMYCPTCDQRKVFDVDYENITVTK